MSLPCKIWFLDLMIDVGYEIADIESDAAIDQRCYHAVKPPSTPITCPVR